MVVTILQDINIESDFKQFEKQLGGLWNKVAYKYASYGTYNGTWFNPDPDYEGEKRCREYAKNRKIIPKLLDDKKYELIDTCPRVIETMKKLENRDLFALEETINESKKEFEELYRSEKNWESLDKKILAIKALGGRPTEIMCSYMEDYYLYPGSYEVGALYLEIILYARKKQEI